MNLFVTLQLLFDIAYYAVDIFGVQAIDCLVPDLVHMLKHSVLKE